MGRRRVERDRPGAHDAATGHAVKHFVYYFDKAFGVEIVFVLRLFLHDPDDKGFVGAFKDLKLERRIPTMKLSILLQAFFFGLADGQQVAVEDQGFHIAYY